ncbi:MAG: DEAD/DEAH box helicase [Polyangiales bacterium]
MATRYGLHIQIVQHSGSLRVALWFEHDGPLTRGRRVRGISAIKHPRALRHTKRVQSLGIPAGAEPVQLIVSRPMRYTGDPVCLPGLRAPQPRRGRAYYDDYDDDEDDDDDEHPLQHYIVDAWMLPPAASLAPLRDYLRAWISTRGAEMASARARDLLPFLDHLLVLVQRGPLLPTLCPAPTAGGEAPLAWVPAVSLKDLLRLARSLGVVDARIAAPRSAGFVGRVPPWNMASFLLEVFAHASEPLALTPSVERALRVSLASAEGPALHRAHDSCLFARHPVFTSLSSPPREHLHARLYPLDATDGHSGDWVMRLGVSNGSGEFLSLDELTAQPDPLAACIERDEVLFAQPFEAMGRDWSFLAQRGWAVLCEPESLGGVRRVSESFAQQVLAQHIPQPPERYRAWQDGLALYGSKRMPRDQLAFSASPGSAASARVRVRWELAETPDAPARLGLHTARFTPTVELAVGGEILDAGEAATLLASSVGPFIRLREHVLPRNDLSAALELLRARELVLKKLMQDGGVSFSRAVSLDDEWSAEREAHAESVFTARWESFLSGLRDGVGVPQLEAPKGFQGTLRPYQARGLSWLAFLAEQGFGGCLADDMGLGKTVQVLALLATRRAPGATAPRGPDLVVCPTAVVTNWSREAKKFTPSLRVYVHQGLDRAKEKRLDAAIQRADVVITSFAIARRDEDALSAVRWGAVIVDEAQNVKNPAAQQTRVLRGLEAESKFALTGTPVENHLKDLWSIFDVMVPGLLGGPTRFARVFETPARNGDAGALARLSRRVGPFLLRRTKSDPAVAADLPPVQEQDIACELSREQAALYEAMFEATFKGITDKDGISRRAHILASLMRLKQICDHPECFETQRPDALLSRSGKLDRALELIEELLEEGQRVLIFTQFTEMGRILQRALAARFKVDAGFYHGGLTGPQREAMIDGFQSEKGPPVLILSLRAGGSGLNLTAASAVIHYDRWWNPAVEDQASDRAHRIGQTRKVNVYRMVTEGTLEERIAELLEQKRALAEKILGGADESWITEMDDRALRAFLSLDRGAKEEP